MSDRYIDYEETQVYGPYASKAMRGLIGLVPALDKGIVHLADELDHATEAVGAAIKHTSEADTAVRKDITDRTPALDSARALLGRFSKHLDSLATPVDRKTFFRTDGTIKGIGASAPRVLLALSHLSSELKKKGSPVKDAAEWQKEVAHAIADLAPVVDHAASAKTSRRSATSEIEAARHAWLQVYSASKSITEGVLRLAGRIDHMTAVFHDLAVSGDAKVTKAPTVPAAPAAPAPPA